MNEIEKLFRKMNKKNSLILHDEINSLLQKKYERGNIKKLQGSDFYRLRKGKFRIIFHYDGKEEIVIDAVRVKSDDTYKDFI